MASMYPPKSGNSSTPNTFLNITSLIPSMPGAGIGAAVAAARPVVETFTTLYGRTLESMASHSMQWGNFVNMRAQENLKLSRRLSDSRTPDDFHAALADFWTTAATHYHTGIMQAATQLNEDVENGARQTRQATPYKAATSTGPHPNT